MSNFINVAYYCVLVSFLLPYIFTVLAKTGKGYNNHAPRVYLSKLTGWRMRANWVQQNTFEIVPFFAAGVIIASITHKPQALINEFAIIFVLSRICYGVCYLLDFAWLRSLLWLVGIGVIIALFCA